MDENFEEAADVDMAAPSKRMLMEEFNQQSASAKKKRQSSRRSVHFSLQSPARENQSYVAPVTPFNRDSLGECRHTLITYLIMHVLVP